MKTKCLKFALILFTGIFLASCTDDSGPLGTDIGDKFTGKTVMQGSYELGKGIVTWKPEASHDVYNCSQFKDVTHHIAAGTMVNGGLPEFNMEFDRFGNYSASYSIALSRIDYNCDEEAETFVIKPPVEEIRSNETGTYELLYGVNGEDGLSNKVRAIELTSSFGKTTTLEVVGNTSGDISEREMLSFNVKLSKPIKLIVSINKMD